MTTFSLEEAHVAIIGLGLMGGSMAMALGGRAKRVGGYDINPGTIEWVKSHKVVDHVFSGVEEIVEQAQVIILATPVGEIIRLLEGMPSHTKSEIMIIDLGSTKVEICKAMERLPYGYGAIGGHPMCGKETLGIRRASPQLYTNAPFALTPIANTSPFTRSIAAQIVESVGASPVWLDPETHDRWVAFTSHLPYLLALTLTMATPLETSLLIGSGFRSASRLAATSSSMMQDILITNRYKILEAFKQYKTHLLQIEQALEEQDEKKLYALLEQGAASYHALVAADGSLA